MTDLMANPHSNGPVVGISRGLGHEHRELEDAGREDLNIWWWGERKRGELTDLVACEVMEGVDSHHGRRPLVAVRLSPRLRHHLP